MMCVILAANSQIMHTIVAVFCRLSRCYCSRAFISLLTSDSNCHRFGISSPKLCTAVQ